MTDPPLIHFRGESSAIGLKFHFIRHDSLLGDHIDDLPWQDIHAVTGFRLQYEDGRVRNVLEFYTQDSSWDLGDAPWEAGWSEVARGINEHLPVRMPDWVEQLQTLELELCLPTWKPEYADHKFVPGKRLLIFLRGSQLPPLLLTECEHHGSYEFVNFPP